MQLFYDTSIKMLSKTNLETKCTGKIDIKCPKELGQKIAWLPAEGRNRL